MEAGVQPGIYPHQAARDLARDKRFTPPRAVVVEEHTVACIHPVALAVVHLDPEGIELRSPIGTARMKGPALICGISCIKQ